MRRVEVLALFYTTVPRALKRGTTRLVHHSAAGPQCPFARGAVCNSAKLKRGNLTESLFVFAKLRNQNFDCDEILEALVQATGAAYSIQINP